MKKMRKWLALLVALVMTFTLLPAGFVMAEDGQEAASLAYIQAKPVELDQNADGDMLTTDGHEWFCYTSDILALVENGDKLVVNGDEYTYDENEQWFINKTGDTIWADSLEVSSDQSYENQWDIGEHEYTLSYYGTTCSFKVTVVENPIKTISFKPAKDIILVEELNGYNEQGWDAETQTDTEWFRYCDIYDDICAEGDQLTVNGTVYTYSLEDGLFLDSKGERLPYRVSTSSDQGYSNQWGIGTHEITLTYRGVSCKVPVEVVPNPVEKVSYKLAQEPYVLYEEASGGWRDDYNYEEMKVYRYFNYHFYFHPGDILYINDDPYTCYYDEEEDEYAFKNADGNVIDEEDLYMNSDQSGTNQWEVGDHEFTLTYRKRTCAVPVSVVPNPVSEISYVPVTALKLTYNKDGSRDEFNNQFEYRAPAPRSGDKLVVDGTDYTFDSGKKAFIAADGQSIQLEEVSIRTDQYHSNYDYEFDEDNSYYDKWSVGETHNLIITYMGRSCQVPVQIVAAKVTKKANTLRVTFKNKTFKAKTLKKKKQSYKAVTIKKAGKGSLVYTVKPANAKAKKALKFSKKTGKITVKKGTKRGKYKITISVKAKGNSKYKASKVFKKKIIVTVK